MPEIVPERILFDGQKTYVGGVASNVEPSILPESHISWGRNIAVRGGFPRQRPGFRMIAQLPEGKIQGGCYFKHSVGSVAASIGGRLYRCDVSGNSIKIFDVSPTTANSARLPQAWMVQANQHLIVQDGVSKPIIHDGSNTFRAEDDEVPVGTCMAFGNARLWVSDRDNVYAGDLAGLDPESHLRFTENTYLSTGGAFVFPGTVTAMAFLPRLDAVTEQGELMVFTNGTVSSIRADVFDRTKWQDTPGMQRLVFPSIGAMGQRSVIASNQDLFFRSSDGIRSIRSTLTDLANNGKTSVSEEVSRVTKQDTNHWLQYVSGVRFDNRILMTAAPRVYRFGTGTNDWVHLSTKILSLDLVPFSILGQESNSAWDGEWTGLNIIQMVTGEFEGVERCFALCVDCTGTNSLWEITRDYEFDLVWPDETVQSATERIPIQSSVEMRRYDFEKPFEPKQLERAELYFSEVMGPVTVTLDYRPETDPVWRSWRSYTFGYGFETCGLDPALCAPPTMQKGIWRRRAGRPDDLICASDQERLTRYGKEFQIRINWVGSARLMKFRATSQIRDQDFRGECDGQY